MVDKKKLMSDLEGLTFEDWHMFHCDTDVQGIAIDALEFLKPRPPAYTNLEYLVNGMPITVRHPSCPRCRESGLTLWDAGIPQGQRFCIRCGQEIEWKEEVKQDD